MVDTGAVTNCSDLCSSDKREGLHSCMDYQAADVLISASNPQTDMELNRIRVVGEVALDKACRPKNQTASGNGRTAVTETAFSVCV